MIKKAVVLENVSPSTETGKPCNLVVNNEPVLTKSAAEKLKMPEIPIEEK